MTIIKTNMFFASIFIATSLFASDVVTRVTVKISPGLERELTENELHGEYLVISEKELPGTHETREAKRELTLLNVGPDKEFPQYTVATTSKVVLTSTPGPRGSPVPQKLEGVLPSGRFFSVELERQIHTEEAKPDGTLLRTFCGRNQQPGIPESSRVSQVCIESGNSVALVQ